MRAARASLVGIGLGAMLMGGSAAADLAERGEGEPDPYITVTQEPAEDDGELECLPPREAATGFTSNTARYFTLIITAQVPMCEPVTAVVYSMPDNFLHPWPQQKVEAVTIEVPRGITTVRFEKGCEPVQFDVVTGGTPDRINPVTGPMHGPLLFEWNPWSALMHFPGDCVPGTTTTTTSTTTTTIPVDETTTTTTTTIPVDETTTTTTSPDGVQGTTTIVGPAVTSGPGPASPAPESQAVAGTTTTTAATGLAVTGGSSQSSTIAAVGLVLLGFALVRLGRILPGRSGRGRPSPFSTSPPPGD